MDDVNENGRPVDETGRPLLTKSMIREESAMKTLENNVAKSGELRNPSFVAPYINAGLVLIPLQGKKPIDSNWTQRVYDVAAVVANAESTHQNLGVRLPPEWLVIDVDPRNFKDGLDSFAKLCADFDIDLQDFPHVQTGGGGLHVYMRKPSSLHTLESLEAYPGVEFKSSGRQVVAVGSIHPDTGKPYVAVNMDLLAFELPAPQALLSALERVTRNQGSTEAGELTPEQVAEALDNLDPADFQDHDKWLELMMSAHHATNGEARQEFIDWSTSDPEYAAHDWIIGRRWDSLHESPTSGNKPITARSFFAIVQKHGSDVPNLPPEQDFEATEQVIPEGKDVVDILNEKHAVVFEGGKFRIFTEEVDPVLKRPFFQRSTKEDFDNYYLNELVEHNDKLITKSKLWLHSAKRRQYKGVIFDPESDHQGWLNLWTGWSVLPKPGDWSLLKELILTVLVNGDLRHYEYVMNWMAYMVQKPSRPAEVALAFRGLKGTGKGTLGRALSDLAGTQGLHISSPEHLTGRFNSHLQNCICLFADEAFWAGDKAGEAVLKQLVTEPTLTYEGKGRDAIKGKNMVHIVIASNSDWIVPATGDERRFAVFEVNTKRQKDKPFFKALNAQLYDNDNAGLSAMLHELLNRDLGEWRPTDNVPKTKALLDQKQLTMTPEESWWTNILESGELPFLTQVDENADWNATEVFVDRDQLFADYLSETQKARKQPKNKQALAIAIKHKAGFRDKQISFPNKKRKWVWIIPSLEEARTLWASAMGLESDEDTAS